MSWLDENPDIVTVCTAVSDLNGQARGKRMPRARARKALDGKSKMPLSALNVDIFGHDIEASPMVFETGDRDGVLHPTDRGPVPMPWLGEPAALVPMTMHTEDGKPFLGDPRHALASVLDRYAARGWRVVAAFEMEFYLIDESEKAMAPRLERLGMGGEVLSLQALNAHDAFFSDFYAACAAMNISADTASSESGQGQYEINLMHGPAMKAADDAWLFKLLAKGLAQQHGHAATFMAKPFAQDAGSGLHVHFSILDKDGGNIFDDGTNAGSDHMRHAVAGCLDGMIASTLVFAPHQNSFARLVPGAHAPTGVCWAYENRTASIRIPEGPGIARRIEHRVAGADANPYLLLASILGAALQGIEAKSTPPAPIDGNAYEQDLVNLPTNWREAIATFSDSKIVSEIFSSTLIRNFELTKNQECAEIDRLTASEQKALYLERV